MTSPMPGEKQKPLTLAEAHELLTRSRPLVAAEPLVWVAFHRRAAEVYARAAKSDPLHKHEAQHWAGAELRQAREIEDRLASPGGESCTEREV